MKKTELVLLSFVIMALALPLLYLSMLLISGNAKLVFEGDLAHAIEVKNQARIQRESDLRDSLMRESSLAFMANVAESERLEQRREHLRREEARVNALKAELDRRQLEIGQLREALEESIAAGDVEDRNRVRRLARVYAAMEPEEAARLMETLTDELCIAIFNNMGDVETHAEILAQMSGAKASRITTQLARSSRR